MRKTLATILISLLPLLGAQRGMQVIVTQAPSATNNIAVVGSVGTGRNAGTITTVATGQGTSATAFSCAAGDLAAVAFNSDGTPPTTGNPVITDSALNTGWTAGPTQYTAQTIWWFYNLNLGSSVTSVTATFASTNFIAMIAAYCISGTTNHFDSTMGQVNNITSSATPWVTGAFTTSQASEIVLTTLYGACPPATATSPAVLGVNYSNSGQITMVSNIYSSTQSGVTFGGNCSGNAQTPTSTIGFY